jgi:hypothetical protein
MKTKLLLLVIVALGAACSAPKSTFYFSYHDYQAGKRLAKVQEVQQAQAAQPSNELASVTPMLPPTIIESPSLPAPTNAPETKPAVTKAEQKALAKEIKQQVKSAVKQAKKLSPPAPTAMDNDLKMAAIFGAIGLGLGLLFGVSAIIGFIGFVAIVVGLFFLIRWLLRQ